MPLHTDAETEIRDGLPAFYPRLWRYALMLTGTRSGADDLAQAAAIRAIEQARHFMPGTHLDRWMFRMTQRLWFNEVRAQKVRQGAGLVPVEEIEIPAKGPGVETNILARQVFSKMSALPEAQRVTALLVYVEGLSYKEAAEMLDIPIGTVMSRLAAARKSLAAATGGETQERVKAK